MTGKVRTVLSRHLDHFPTGWFQIAWSDEVPAGSVTPLKYFDTELVLVRNDTGVLALFDAHCPHLGAHLGYGGTIVDDCLQCPFHGWRFDMSGENVEIPYSPRPMRRPLRRWHTDEVNGMVLAWYDEPGREPLWRLPQWPEANSDAWYGLAGSRGIFENRVGRPQWMIENVVDTVHQKFVHRAAAPSEILSYDDTDPARFQVWQTLLLNASKRKTFLTDAPKVGRLEIEAWGTGIGMVRFHEQDDALQVQGFTPVDHEHCDLRTTLFIKVPAEERIDGAPKPETLARAQHIIHQVEKDLKIWEHMRYVERAPFSVSEARHYSAFRRWTEQFYPVGQPMDASVDGAGDRADDSGGAIRAVAGGAQDAR